MKSSLSSGSELADEFGVGKALGVALVGGAHVGELDLVVVGVGLRVEADRQQHWDVVAAPPDL